MSMCPRRQTGNYHMVVTYASGDVRNNVRQLTWIIHGSSLPQMR